MTVSAAAKPAPGMTSTRPGASRKLLSRKAAEKVAIAEPGQETIEASFPLAKRFTDDETVPFSVVSDSAFAPENAQQPPAATACPAQAPAASGWSSEDESAFQSLAARRKAAGYSRRGKDISDQRITLGTIAPNPGTVVAVISAIVTEHGGIRRADLIAAMASANFPTGKAKPTDVDWCQGYVAGAVRNGFLTADAEHALAKAK